MRITNSMTRACAVMLFALLTCGVAQASIIAKWTVPSGTVLTFPIGGSVSSSVAADIGTGTLFATRVFVGSSTVVKTWGVNAPPDNSTIPAVDDGTGSFSSFSNRFPTTPSLLEMTVSTIGQSGIQVAFDSIRKTIVSGPTYAMRYSVDVGTNFTFAAAISPVTGSGWEHLSADLSSDTALNNQSSVIFQIEATGGSLSGGFSAEGALDNIEIFTATTSMAAPEPATFILFAAGLAGIGFGRRHRQVVLVSQTP